ncbi:MAG: hypothetical protein FWC10_03930, partial [Lentimicrobiaceae bacterium]|nr:hypothetical protein [Lentimicrobiaceae bacterium]
TKIKTSKRRLDTISLNPDKNKYGAYSTDTPMEYEVEKQNRTITPFIRIESALHFKKMVENTHPECDALITKLIALCPLEPFIPLVAEKDKTIETLKLEQNANLKRLYATYGKRMFDGYTLYLMPIDKIENILNEAELSHIPLNELLQNYQAWFTRKYLPVTHHEGGCWNESKLGYEVAMGENLNSYDAENYHTGQLSWYSFDAAEGAAASIAKLKGKSSVELPEEKEEKMFSYLPAPAEFPGAPSKTLWEFEDARVQLGQMDNNDFSLLANAVVMQYTTMYGNDWMVTPIETETGTILEVDGIIITDTFGERIFINTSAEEADANDNSKAFTDRWSMFGTTQANAYEKNNFSSRKGLLFPPTLSRCEESHPIEEVQFLRDEMANMLWGVETTINNGCDGTLSGKSLSDAVLTEVDAQKGEHVVNENEYDYSFLVQNRAPLNWIPFIPQKIPTEIRDIRFRRGKMPIFFNGIYDSVRPSTQLLGIKKDDRNEKIVPLFINEEEITGYGVKLVLTAQRTRWFHGESFNWIGYKKVINMYQANSGLMFDELIERETQKSIVLHPEEETEL